VPYVENDDEIFLKTAFPNQTLISSIAHKYLNGCLTPKS